MPFDFCHIVPTAHLEQVAGRNHHLTLAHLVEENEKYVQFYVNEKNKNPNMINIMDNSAFEMVKQGKPFYPSDKLIEMGRKVNADYVVLSDYPAEPWTKTMYAAENLIPQFKAAGLGTFYVPQAEIGDISGLINSFIFAATHEDIDYIAISILSAPNAFGVERGNKLQRFLSRYQLCKLLADHVVIDGVGYWDYIREVGKKIHFLGMVDGPREIELIQNLHIPITTWDSSAAVWAGLHNINFDSSPTGLIDGKFEKEVDFDSTLPWTFSAENNITFIDDLVGNYK